jgi:hypothetical protein
MITYKMLMLAGPLAISSMGNETSTDAESTGTEPRSTARWQIFVATVSVFGNLVQSE